MNERTLHPAADAVTGSLSSSPAIVPREKLDFGLDGDIPRYWFGGHPFKTRFFDAMSTIFPEGERFFIMCVRDYRDQVTDPKLLADIRDFIRQEGQHGMAHDAYNRRLKDQGINVDGIEAFQRKMLFEVMRRHLPKAATLAHTAAAEHMTSIMADIFFARPEVLAEADPRMRAMYVWHAMEEVEHKAVAFDVMRKVAKVGWLRRCFELFMVSLLFPLHVFILTNYMLKVDGFSRWQRLGMFVRGLGWLYGPKGLFSSALRPYLAYYKPGFHPWQQGQSGTYRIWLDVMTRTNDPLAASEAVQRELAAA